TIRPGLQCWHDASFLGRMMKFWAGRKWCGHAHARNRVSPASYPELDARFQAPPPKHATCCGGPQFGTLRASLRGNRLTASFSNGGQDKDEENRSDHKALQAGRG